MDMTGEQKERVSVLERHAQSIVLAVILAALFFAGRFVWETNATMTAASKDILHLGEQMREVKALMLQQQQTYATRDEIRDHEKRLRTLEDTRRNSH